jgi:hypothetical protein
VDNTYFMGWSRGRWEGETLVVDVTGMSDKNWLDRDGNFHSDAAHVVERLTAVSPYHLWYEATIEDPKVFTRPWKISFPLYRRMERDVQLMEFKCQPFVEDCLWTFTKPHQLRRYDESQAPNVVGCRPSCHCRLLAARGQLTWRPTTQSAGTGDDENWTPPKTPWGDPDLQGIYNYGTSTPLQRPPGRRNGAPRRGSRRPQVGEIARPSRRRAQADDVPPTTPDGSADEADTDKRTAHHRSSGSRLPRVELQLTPEEQARVAQDLSTRRFNTGFQESYLDMDVGNRCIIRRRNGAADTRICRPSTTTWRRSFSRPAMS